MSLSYGQKSDFMLLRVSLVFNSTALISSCLTALTDLLGLRKILEFTFCLAAVSDFFYQVLVWLGRCPNFPKDIRLPWISVTLRSSFPS